MIISIELFMIFNPEYISNQFTNDLGWLPEVWLAVLILVLGTLIIVISVAAQSVPEIISLFFKSWISLSFLWLITISTIQSIIITIVENIPISIIYFNTFIILPFSLIISIPYVVINLQNIRPIKVINKIKLHNFYLLESISKKSFQPLFENPKIVSYIQESKFETMNQLNDLFFYLNFQQPKIQAIITVLEIYRYYIKIKRKIINLNYFNLADSIKSDNCFITSEKDYVENVVAINNSFFEHKINKNLQAIVGEIIKTNDQNASETILKELKKTLKLSLHEKDNFNTAYIRKTINMIFHRYLNDDKNESLLWGFLLQYRYILTTLIEENAFEEFENYLHYLNRAVNQISLKTYNNDFYSFSLIYTILRITNLIIKNINDTNKNNINLQIKIMEYNYHIINKAMKSEEYLEDKKRKFPGLRGAFFGLSIYLLQTKNKVLLNESVKYYIALNKEPYESFEVYHNLILDWLEFNKDIETYGEAEPLFNINKFDDSVIEFKNLLTEKIIINNVLKKHFK